MAKNKRVSREEINPEEFDLLKPIDILSLGGEDDPCFGKLYDLVASECKICGDREFCAILSSQNLLIKNQNMEAVQRFKDVEEGEKVKNQKIKTAQQLIAKYQLEGIGPTKILLKVMKETKLNKEEVKKLINT